MSGRVLNVGQTKEMGPWHDEHQALPCDGNGIIHGVAQAQCRPLFPVQGGEPLRKPQFFAGVKNGLMVLGLDHASFFLTWLQHWGSHGGGAGRGTQFNHSDVGMVKQCCAHIIHKDASPAVGISYRVYHVTVQSSN